MNYRHLVVLAAMLALVSSSRACAAEAEWSAIRGVYVAGFYGRSTPDYALQHPDVDVLLIRLYWSQVQPAPDRFDWSLLDGEISRCVARSKKVAVAIVAGSFTPEWVYARGVPSLTFTVAPHQGKSSDVKTSRIPIPWNSVYLEQYDRLVHALAAHLCEAGMIDAVVQLKVTGINLDTNEIRLPAQVNVVNRNTGRKTSDAVGLWKSVDYRPRLVLEAWEHILGTYAAAFPGKSLAAAIISKGGFPAIDDAGNVSSEYETATTAALVEIGITKFHDVFAVQQNALNVTHGTWPLIDEAHRRGVATGYQLQAVEFGRPNSPAVPDAGPDAKPADEAKFRAAIDNGIAHGAQYIEVFARDVPAYPETISYAHHKLKRRGQ